MPKQLPKDKPDYSIELRTRLKNGFWGDWIGRGDGKWIDLQTLQDQIKMLIKAHSRDMQIKVIKDGKMIDYFGNETDKPIEYEKSRR